MVGLRPEITVRVRLHEPRSLEKMMMLALGVEDCLVVENESGVGWQNRTGIACRYPISRGNYQVRGDHQKPRVSYSTKSKMPQGYEKQTTPFDNLGKTLSHLNRNTGKKNPYRRLSLEEKKERQEKGLCYRCDERFAPGHRCQLQALQVYVVNENGS